MLYRGYAVDLEKAKEEANTIFYKIDDNIYEIIKDRKDHFSGRVYVSTSDVIDELNTELKVLILGDSQLGTKIIYKSF